MIAMRDQDQQGCKQHQEGGGDGEVEHPLGNSPPGGHGDALDLQEGNSLELAQFDVSRQNLQEVRNKHEVDIDPFAGVHKGQETRVILLAKGDEGGRNALAGDDAWCLIQSSQIGGAGKR